MKRRGRFEEQSAMEVSLEATLAGRACRTALRRSPASCRVALAAHRARIDPALSNILKIVGDYEGKVGLHFNLFLWFLKVCQYCLLTV